MAGRRILAGSRVGTRVVGIRSSPPSAEIPPVNKSILAVAGIGIAGCVLLSILMKQVVALDAEQRQLPFLPALEAKFGPRLGHPIKVREQDQAGIVRLHVSARVRDGIDGAQLAREIGADLWLHAVRAGSKATEAVVALRREDGGELLTLVLPRNPAASATPKPAGSAPQSPAAGKPPSPAR